MDFGRTLRILWNRRRLVAVGVLVALIAAVLSVYRVSLFPPSVTNRTNVFATASTQVLIDTPSSAFADLASDLDPLDTRANVFARFLASPTAVELIARHAKLPVTAIEAQGPYNLNLPTYMVEPTAEQRSSQIVGEGALYRLRFSNDPDLPIISIFAQAPTRGEAIALAGAVPSALRGYIERLQVAQHTPVSRRVEIRRLGDATGAVVNDGANIQIALLVFLVVFFGWCMLLVPAQTIARGWRESGDSDLGLDGSTGSNGNGRVHAPAGHSSPQRTH
jgi:hypothetical protein